MFRPLSLDTAQLVTASRHVTATLVAGLETTVAALRATGRFVVSHFDLRDAFVFSGLGAVWYGVAQVHPPAAFVVVGAALFWIGVRR